MKKISLLLLIFLLFNVQIFSDSLIHELTPVIERKIWSDSSLSPAEAQLLANVIFLSIYRAQAQQSFYYYANGLSAFALLAEKNISAGLDNIGIEGLKTSIENLEALFPITKSVISLHEKLIDDLVNHQNKQMLEIFEQCAQHAAYVAIQSSNQKKENVLTLVEQSANNYCRESENIQALAHSFHILKNDAIENRTVHTAQIIENIRHNLFSSLDQTLYRLHEQKYDFNKLVFDLENNALTIFKRYYEIIYRGMQKHSFDSSYYAILAYQHECEIIRFAQLPDPSCLED
jgi:hypothetical protein